MESPNRKFKKISREEALFVARNWDKLTLDQLAEQIKRPVSTVLAIRKGLVKNGLRLTPKISTQGINDLYKSVAVEVASEKFVVK